MTYQTQQVLKKIGIITLLVTISIFSLLIGVQDLSFQELFSLNETQVVVLLSTRIPRTISLILAGATLSVSGLLMQQITQNRFVSPSTAGTMASARFGIIISMILFSGTALIQRTLFAFIFAMVGTIMFALFVRTMKKKNSIMVPLVGIMFGNIIGSIGTYFALRFEIVQNASSWLQGNFSLVTSNNFQLIFLSVPVFILIYMFAHYFTVMGLGEDVATQLGMSYSKIEIFGIMIVAISTTAVLLTVGSVPFVGIIIPNLISLKMGDNFRKILFPTAIFGAIFLLVCDILARTIIFPYEIPVSVIIGVIGSLLFLFLLLRGEKG